jgi:hypothetical protein
MLEKVPELFNFLIEIIYSLLDYLLKLVIFLFNFTPSSDFLSDALAFEGILIGVTIPISLQVVSGMAERYRDQEIAKFFIDERLYRSQYILFFSNIGLSIFVKFWNEAKTSTFLLWILFLWFIGNIIVFYIFIRLVEQYITNTDKLLLGKLNNYVEAILKK